jgi:hypothetical protein
MDDTLHHPKIHSSGYFESRSHGEALFDSTRRGRSTFKRNDDTKESERGQRLMNALSSESIRDVWQPYYSQPLSDSDVVEIKSNVSHLLAYLSKWAIQHKVKTPSQVYKD